MISGIVCTLFVTLVTPAAAQPGGSIRTGTFGDIRLGGGLFSARASGLDVLADNERLESLDARGGRQEEGFGLIGGELGYGFAKTGTTLLVGVDSQDPVHLSLRQQADGWGELAISALYQEKDVWENPYLSGVKRSGTGAESVGFALSWNNILSTGVRISFEQMHTDVAEDRIGQMHPDLRRDGTDSKLAVEYSWDLGGAGVLNPSLSHTWIDRQGAGNAGNAIDVALAHLFTAGRLCFATKLEVRRTEFDALHVIFDKKREESAFGISEMVSLAEPLGFENWYLIGFAAYSETAANITFFDSSGIVLGSGIGYRF
jgi:hypothetical protein